MRNLYFYSLILIAFIAIGFLYRTIILGIFKQVFYFVTLTKTALRSITEKVTILPYGNSKNKNIQSVEKIYLMTTNSSEFYKQLGFNINKKQSLLILNKNEY